MPFGESQSRVYVSIVDGQLAVRSSDADTKAVKRELKTGHIIYERRYKNVTGRLKEIGFRVNDFNGKKWDDLYLLIYDGQDHYQISMPFPGKFSLSVLRSIKNAPLEKNITFSPWTKTKSDGKISASLFMNPEGTKDSVPWYFTPDDPKGLPDLVPYTVPGSEETKWSDVERNKFFRSMIETEIAPKLRQLWESPLSQAATQPVITDPADIIEPVDDLPF